MFAHLLAGKVRCYILICESVRHRCSFSLVYICWGLVFFTQYNIVEHALFRQKSLALGAKQSYLMHICDTYTAGKFTNILVSLPSWNFNKHWYNWFKFFCEVSLTVTRGATYLNYHWCANSIIGVSKNTNITLKYTLTRYLPQLWVEIISFGQC